MDQNLYRADLAGEHGAPIKPLVPSARAETDPDVSPDGSRIAFVSDRLGHKEIWLMQADGSDLTQLTNLRSVCWRPRWSPDGHQIVFNVGLVGMNRDIHVIDDAGGAPRRLTADASSDEWPTWSQDGRWIYFMSDRSGAREIWKVPAVGGPAVQVTKGGGVKAWESRDGRFLFYSTAPARAPAIWRMPVSGGTPTLVLNFPEGTSWGGEWVLTDSGIYWVNREASPRPAIEFLSFVTGSVTRAVTPLGAYDTGSGFSVSPDGRWLVFTQREYSSSDIMMMEGIR
jgi:Tol biopolymer transport system component